MSRLPFRLESRHEDLSPSDTRWFFQSSHSTEALARKAEREFQRAWPHSKTRIVEHRVVPAELDPEDGA